MLASLEAFLIVDVDDFDVESSSSSSSSSFWCLDPGIVLPVDLMSAYLLVLVGW